MQGKKAEIYLGKAPLPNHFLHLKVLVECDQDELQTKESLHPHKVVVVCCEKLPFATVSGQPEPV